MSPRPRNQATPDRDVFRDPHDDAPAGDDELRGGIVALYLRMEKERRDLSLLLERERLLMSGELARQTELIEIGSAALVVTMLHVVGVASVWWFALVIALGAYRHWHWGEQAKARQRRVREIEAALERPPAPSAAP